MYHEAENLWSCWNYLGSMMTQLLRLWTKFWRSKIKHNFLFHIPKQFCGHILIVQFRGCYFFFQIFLELYGVIIGFCAHERKSSLYCCCIWFSAYGPLNFNKLVCNRTSPLLFSIMVLLQLEVDTSHSYDNVAPGKCSNGNGKIRHFVSLPEFGMFMKLYSPWYVFRHQLLGWKVLSYVALV